MHPQLVLALDTAPARSFDTFHVDQGNALTVQSVRAFCDGTLEEPQLLIWGATGAGKSHLLGAACQHIGELGYRVAYLPGELANQEDALVGLEQFELVCVDDLQRLDRAAEIELFHCINRCRAAGARLLFSADRAADELAIALPDLLTRLSWGPVFQLQPLDDESLAMALRQEIENRSLDASEEVIGFILRRFPRHMAGLKRTVDQLDRASLREQRRITVPLVREVFGFAEEEGGSER